MSHTFILYGDTYHSELFYAAEYCMRNKRARFCVSRAKYNTSHDYVQMLHNYLLNVKCDGCSRKHFLATFKWLITSLECR